MPYIHGGSGTGDFSTTYTILSNRLVVDMRDVIFLLEPDQAPLSVLTGKLKKEATTNVRFDWMDDELVGNLTAITNNMGTGGTTATLGSAGGATGDYGMVVPNSLIKVQSTGELMLVTNVNTTNGQVTVTRGYAGTTQAATDGSSTPVPVSILGPAFRSGSSATDLVYATTRQTSGYNYTQIFRMPVKVSKSLEASKLYGGSERLFQQKKKGIEMARQIEAAFLFGNRYNDTSAGRRLTGGLTFFISNYVTNIGGALTYTALETHLRQLFRYGRNRKFAFCSLFGLSTLNLLAKLNGSIQLVPKDVAFGLSITQWISPHGTLMLVPDNQIQGTTYQGYLFMIEMEELAYRYLRDVQLETNLQIGADDFYLDVYTAEVGLEFHCEAKHRLLTGITGAATG